MSDKGPRLKPRAVFCRDEKHSNNFVTDMIASGVLETVTIGNRVYIDNHAYHRRLDEAKASNTPLILAGPVREAELARKTAWRQQRRAQAREAARPKPRARKSPKPEGHPSTV